MIFLDTSGILALVSPHDRFHDAARDQFLAARRFLTHNYVLAELVPLARVRRVPVTGMLDALASLLSGTGTTCVWLDRETHERAVVLLRKRPDKEYSLCDAVSFVLMREQSIAEALTTDQHFEQEGFVRLLKP
jgi:predicted nucleic acid-binding protein